PGRLPQRLRPARGGAGGRDRRRAHRAGRRRPRRGRGARRHGCGSGRARGAGGGRPRGRDRQAERGVPVSGLRSRRAFLLGAAALGGGTLLGGGAVLAGCASSGSTLGRALDDGVVTIGIANEAPYGYTGPDGAVTGEAVEVARAVFAGLG